MILSVSQLFPRVSGLTYCRFSPFNDHSRGCSASTSIGDNETVIALSLNSTALTNQSGAADACNGCASVT